MHSPAPGEALGTQTGRPTVSTGRRTRYSTGRHWAAAGLALARRWGRTGSTTGDELGTPVGNELGLLLGEALGITLGDASAVRWEAPGPALGAAPLGYMGEPSLGASSPSTVGDRPGRSWASRWAPSTEQHWRAARCRAWARTGEVLGEALGEELGAVLRCSRGKLGHLARSQDQN
jgi:hypothetical protein